MHLTFVVALLLGKCVVKYQHEHKFFINIYEISTEIVPSTEKENFHKVSMKLYMKYSEGAESIDKYIFSHVSHPADAVESCAGFTFRICTSPDTFISIGISCDPIREITLQISLQNNSKVSLKNDTFK
jgi:hypothetical protein